MDVQGPVDFTLRRARADDVDWMAELRADVMADDLRRLGRYDPVRVRERFRAGFEPACTWVVEVPDGSEAQALSEALAGSEVPAVGSVVDDLDDLGGASAVRDVGLIALRPADDGTWIEHFYLDRSVQGLGLGGAVLTYTMAADSGPRPFRLNVLQGSPARRLYERHGFILDHEDPIDVFLVHSVD